MLFEITKTSNQAVCFLYKDSLSYLVKLPLISYKIIQIV